MQLNPVLREALGQVAKRHGAEVDALHRAIEGESSLGLAQALGIEADVAEEHMARLRRALTVQSDFGAGCKLLADDVEAEVLAALSDL